ncbi:MAG TPA: sigma-70 family RNA polymerase sigma factor [Blastocatellia bacterium]|nr:sigma-70 family RNA polymerase sigma factor [Blastocatellia bacterium]
MKTPRVELGAIIRRTEIKNARGAILTHEITQWLTDWSNGDRSALEKLTPLVYRELHRLAQSYMRGERVGHALQTTALVNEAYLRLIETEYQSWQNRAHFYGAAAKLMRHILVDFARSRDRIKRGGGLEQVSLDEALTITADHTAELLDLDEALTTLSKLDERQSQVVELRFFGGLTEEAIAEVLKVSERTVQSDWSLARSWLLRELSRDKRDDA